MFVFVLGIYVNFIFFINELRIIFELIMFIMFDLILERLIILFINCKRCFVLFCINLIYFCCFFLLFMIESKDVKFIIVFNGVCILWFILVINVDFNWLVFFVFFLVVVSFFFIIFCLVMDISDFFIVNSLLFLLIFLGMVCIFNYFNMNFFFFLV